MSFGDFIVRRHGKEIPRESATPGNVVTVACPECGAVSTFAIAHSRNCTEFHPLADLGCRHQAMHDAASDLAGGLDPDDRCPLCGENPCAGPRGPGSC